MTVKKKDTIFAKSNAPKIFKFDKHVANVFDEMIERSVPFYHEIQRMIIEQAKVFAKQKTNVYDLGCSTGISIYHLVDALKKKDISIIGYDNSKEMLKHANKRMRASLKDGRYQFKVADLNKSVDIENASVVLLVLTLQFIDVLQRPALIRQIFNGLNKGGALFVVEKISATNQKTNQIFTDFYYEFKAQNGYSELEVAKKREALENVLTPLSVEENMFLLTKSGFKSVDTFFNWYNFCGILAIK